MVIILLQNVALLVALLVIYQLISRRWQNKRIWSKILSGLLFGVVCMVSMVTPFVFTEGIVIDGRSIILAVAGFFGGPVVAALSVLVSAPFRLMMGGAGAQTGVYVISASAAIGVIFYYLRKHYGWVTQTWALWVFGLLVHAVMIAFLWQIPDSMGQAVVRMTGPTVIILFPLATLLVCRIFLDSESRIETENRLFESEERHRTTLLSIGDAVISTDRAGNVVLMNEHAELLTGWTQSEAAGRPLEEVFNIFSEDTGETMENPIKEVFREGRIVGLANHTLLLARDGTKRPIADSAAPIFDAEANLTGAVLVFRDQSAEREAQQALEQSERRLATLMSHVPGMIYRCKNESGRPLEFVSDGCKELTGFDPGSLTRQGSAKFADIIHAEDRQRVEVEIAGALGKNSDYSVSYRIHPAKGEVKWVEDHGRLIRDGSDGTEYLEGLILDISERIKAEMEKKGMEEHLLQAQKMEAVGRLAGGVAHDFNNMLTVINGHTELALQSPQATGVLRDYLKAILHAGARSADLTRQLLTYARRQTICPEALDLNQTVGSMLSMLRRLIGENIEIDWQPEAHSATVLIDPAQLDQIIVNLVLNARDAISSSGNIKLATRDFQLTEDTPKPVEGMPAGNYAVISVSDDGCGMDEDTLQHIFEPFFTTKSKGHGTGLGLATVFGCVTQSMGFIEVSSKPGKGSVFTLYLPQHTANDDMSAAPDQTDMALPSTGAKILLVEDEEGILRLSELMLSRLGYNVVCANSPHAALKLAEEADTAFDLLITDVIMPKMNGHELWQILNSKTPVKCLYVSGYTADILNPEKFLEKPVHFLQKPFTMNDLAQKVSEILIRR